MLKRIRIKNFRSLNVTVDLDPVTVLVGKSGTGKTNFVEAIRFLRDIIRRVEPTKPISIGSPRNAASRLMSEDDAIEFDVGCSKTVKSSDL